MKTAKEEILGLLTSLPDEMSLDDILDRIELKARLLHSIEQAERGELIPHDQVMEELEEWARSIGHPTRAATSNK